MILSNQNMLLIISLIMIVFSSTALLYFWMRDKYVKNNSDIYKSVIDLNKSSKLEFVVKQFSYKRNYTNKSSLDNANLFNVALLFAADNRKEIEHYIEKYKICNQKYNDYWNKYYSIVNKQSDNKIEPNIFFRNYKSFNKYELELCEDQRINNTSSISMYVLAEYISPKGRNYWHKEVVFSYNDIICVLKTLDNQEIIAKSIKYQRDIMSDSLRYNILKRDNFRCQICGRTQLDGVKLEVDHIIPVSKGGLTIESNLRTLCERCNRGKSNKIE